MTTPVACDYCGAPFAGGDMGAWAAAQDLGRPIDLRTDLPDDLEHTSYARRVYSRRLALESRAVAEGWELAITRVLESAFDIGMRAYHTLFNRSWCAFITAAAVTRATDAELRKVRGLGEVTLGEIRQVFPYAED